MIRLFINGLAASAGGGLTYLRNVIPHLARRSDVETTVLLNSAMCGEFSESPNVVVIENKQDQGASRRFFYEQSALPGLIRQSNAQVLISAGNFALWRSPVPQILLSRNSLYTSRDFYRDVRARHDYRIYADTVAKGWLARRSILRADLTVAPSGAFAEELSRWSGRKVVVVHHGFDLDAFANHATPLPEQAQVRLDHEKDALRLLFVSHYNYYRNFETLLRAMPILRNRINQKKVRLFLTCILDSDKNPGIYRAESAALLADDLRRRGDIVELGTVPYRSLHRLYRACNIYVTPAYAESFAHPLVEAMASGLPVAASDLPVHREICGDAAVYFSRFSPDELAERIVQIEQSPELAKKMSSQGLLRARDFSWREHVERLVGLAQDLLSPGRGRL
jgi:glycosyltransferase involved in cell wall biosynthesis